MADKGYYVIAKSVLCPLGNLGLQGLLSVIFNNRTHFYHLRKTFRTQDSMVTMVTNSNSKWASNSKLVYLVKV